MAKKIIIFDDDLSILAISRMILEDEAWEVQTFPNCQGIVEKVREINPDVILMDNQIPDEGGVVAIKKLKNEDDLKNIPVIFFSGSSDIEELALEAGATTYLEKPFDIDQLDQALSRAAI